jgi:acyl carrier protein
MTMSRAALWDTIVGVLEEQMAPRGLQREDFAPSATLSEIGVSSLDGMNLMVTLEDTLGCRLGFQNLVSEDGLLAGDLTLAELLEIVDQRFRAGDDELGTAAQSAL